MKVAAIANAMEQYNYSKNKLNDSETELMECRLLGVLNGNEGGEMKCQEMRVNYDKKELADLLNTDINDVPLIHPQFAVNNTKKIGFLLNKNA